MSRFSDTAGFGTSDLSPEERAEVERLRAEFAAEEEPAGAPPGQEPGPRAGLPPAAASAPDDPED